MIIPVAHAKRYFGDSCKQLCDSHQRNQTLLVIKDPSLMVSKPYLVDAEVELQQDSLLRDPIEETSNTSACCRVSMSEHFGEGVGCADGKLQGCN